MHLGTSIASFFLLYQFHYTQHKVIYIAKIKYFCKSSYLNITFSLTENENNKLCERGEMLLEEGDDKNDDGRYHYFGVDVKVHMCNICNAF